jgi:hypothetical protein
MHGFIPAVLAVQLLLLVLTYVSGRGRHEVDKEGVNIFRISPVTGWFMTIGCLAISLFVAIDILDSKPTPMNAPVVDWVVELATFLFGLIAIYYLTLQIRVDSQSLRVSSFLGARTTNFREIGSVDNNEAGRWRTLNVTTTNKKRVLNVTSSFLPDYDRLVELLEDGMDDCKAQRARDK